MNTETITFTSLATTLDSRALRLLSLIEDELVAAKRTTIIDHMITNGTLAQTLALACAL